MNNGAAGLIRNSQWNLLAFGLGLAANLLTIPFVVRTIGIDAFGVVGLVIAICAPALVVGTVISQSLVREISVRLDGGKDFARRPISAALRLCAVMTVIGWCLLAGLGPTLMKLLSDGANADIRSIFVIAASGWAAQQFATVLQGVSMAQMNYMTVAKVSAVYSTACVGLVIALTSTFGSAESYILALSLSFGVLLVAWCVASRKTVSWRDALRPSNREDMRAILRFSSWQGLAQIIGTVSLQADRYLLGAIAPLAAVGEFNIAKRVQEAGSTVLIKGGEVAFPRFGALQADTAIRKAHFFKVITLAYCTTASCILAPIGILAQPLLSLWAGSEVENLGSIVLRTLAVSSILGAATDMAMYQIMGNGRNASIALLSLIYSIVAISTTIAMLVAFGPAAAGLGGLAAAAVRDVATAWILREHSDNTLTWGDFALCMGVPTVGGSVAVSLAMMVEIPQIESWLILGLTYIACAGSVGLAVTALVCVVPDGRNLCLELVRRIRR